MKQNSFLYLLLNTQDFPIRIWETEITLSSAMNFLNVNVTGFTVMQLKVAGYALSTAKYAFEERELLSLIRCTLLIQQQTMGRILHLQWFNYKRQDMRTSQPQTQYSKPQKSFVES